MKKGDKIKYEAFGTRSLYDAEIIAERGDRFDIAVVIPGEKEPFPLHAVLKERLRLAP